MKKKFVFAVIVLAGFFNLSASKQNLSTKKDTKAYSFKSGKSIYVDLPSHINISIGEKASVTLNGPSKDLSKIDVKSIDNTIKITSDKKIRNTIKITITIPELSKLELYGAITTNLDANNNNSLTLNVIASGSQFIEITNLNVEKFILLGSGSGDAEIKGKAKKQTIQLSGAFDYHALNLESDKASLNITGSSLAEINAKNITGIAAGSSNIRHKNSKKTDVSCSGASSCKSLSKQKFSQKKPSKQQTKKKKDDSDSNDNDDIDEYWINYGKEWAKWGKAWAKN